MSEVRGIFQSDLILETAIRSAFADLRANPWLLPYIFRSLVDDPHTAKEYGQKQVDTAVRWLLKTEFPVFINARLDGVRFPSVTINLVSSNEAENTLADIHHDPTESVAETDSSYWPALTPAFVPVSWNSASGQLVVPPEITVDLYPGMIVFDRNGAQYPIVDVLDGTSQGTTVVLAPGTLGNFGGAVIKSGSPPVLDLESASFQESYLIGCHVVGESWQLIVLHSAVAFLLLRYRERFLEKRGFQISSLTSSDFSKNTIVQGDQVWSRYITLSGRVHNVWPKDRRDVIGGVNQTLRVSNTPHLPADTDPNTASWIGDLDSLSGSSR